MSPVDFGELLRIAENAIERPADRANLLQLAERFVDLGTAGTEQQGKLALRHTEIQRQALTRHRFAIANGDQEEARQPYMHRMQRDRLELPAGVPQPAA